MCRFVIYIPVNQESQDTYRLGFIAGRVTSEDEEYRDKGSRSDRQLKPGWFYVAERMDARKATPYSAACKAALSEVLPSVR